VTFKALEWHVKATPSKVKSKYFMYTLIIVSTAPSNKFIEAEVIKEYTSLFPVYRPMVSRLLYS